MKLRSELFKEVQARLNAGQRKEKIYSELKEKYPATAVERSLAQWPYPEAKTANNGLNRTLLSVWTILLVLKVALLVQLSPSLPAAAWPLLLLGVAIPVYVWIGLKNFNLIAYFLVILLSINSLLGFRALSKETLLLAVMVVAAMVLAWIQKKRLFPNASWLLRHKKDTNGNPVF